MSDPGKPETRYSIQFIKTWRYYRSYVGTRTPATTNTVAKLIDAEKMSLEQARNLVGTLYLRDETQIVVNPFPALPSPPDPRSKVARNRETA
jgi:hypothetical protein